MADGKWIMGLDPAKPLVDAARRALQLRLRVVLECLPAAAESAWRDVEHVHQLRVGCRRAAAALRLFADCMPAKRHRSIRKLVRSVRQAAGAARDWDVFLLLIGTAPTLASQAARPAHDFVFGLATAYRFEAQRLLAESAAQALPLLRDEYALLRKGKNDWRKPDARTTGERAIESITLALKQVDSALDPPPTTYEQFHHVRILGKRLRYAMEIFIDCFPASMREEIYPAVESMQEILGRITDAHLTVERLIQIREHSKAFHPRQWPRYRKAFDAFLQNQRSVIPRERKRFLAWIADWRKLDAAGQIRLPSA